MVLPSIPGIDGAPSPSAVNPCVAELFNVDGDELVAVAAAEDGVEFESPAPEVPVRIRKSRTDDS